MGGKRNFDTVRRTANGTRMVIAEARRLAEQQEQARAAAAEYAVAVRGRFGPRVQWIWLFGSLARGDWLGPEEADVDVAVVLDQRTFAEEMELVDLATHVGWRHALAISPRIFSAEDFDRLHRRELRLAEDILTEGVAL